MKLLRALFLALLIFPALASAQTAEIGSYPNAATPLIGTERLLGDQSATSVYPCIACTVNLTPLQLSNFVASQAYNEALLFNNNGSIGGIIPGAPGQYCLQWSSLIAPPTLVACTGGGGGGGAFSSISSGTNTSATMIVGTGASLSASGTGTISATSSTISLSLTGNPTNGQYWGYNGTIQGWFTPTGSGTVTSSVAGDIAYYATTGTTVTGATLGTGLCIVSGVTGICEPVTINTGNSYTVAAAWCGSQQAFTSATAVAVSLPAGTGSLTSCQFDIAVEGAGKVTVTPAGGVDVNASTNPIAAAQNSQCSFNADNSGNWHLIGCTALISGSGGGITGSGAQYQTVVWASSSTVTGVGPGTSGQCYMSNGASANPSFQTCPSGTGGTPQNVQVFTSSGTWTKPSGTPTITRALCIGGGGGGGSGSVQASGTPASGGGGGGGGRLDEVIFPTSTLPATVTVTIGAGGTGGASVSSIGGGLHGTNGSNSSFGTYVTGYGGGNGGGGVASVVSFGGSGGGLLGAASGNTQGSVCSGLAGDGGAGGTGCPGGGGGGGATGNTGGAGGAGGPAFPAGSGGGGGGGITSTPAASAGGSSGASANSAAVSGGTAGNPGSPGSISSGAYAGGTGGGGGGGAITGNAGGGGAGATGGGGGGGGSAVSGGNSGAGGNGGYGICVIITTY